MKLSIIDSWLIKIHYRNILLFSQFGLSATINMADGSFNITGNGVDGEGTYTVSNGTAEIGLHVVLGEMALKQELVIAGDKAAVNSLKTTSLSDHTETELTFTKEGKMFPRIHYSCILLEDTYLVILLRWTLLLKNFLIMIKLFLFWESNVLLVKSIPCLYRRKWNCRDVIDSKFSIQGFTIVTNQLVRVEAVQ